jgi:uncharacterized membrane protein
LFQVHHSTWNQNFQMTELKFLRVYRVLHIHSLLGHNNTMLYQNLQKIYLKDHPEYSITEAITESKKIMQGYKWKYFLLHLSFIGWGILSLFTLGIGLLWLIPYMNTSLASFYNQRIEAQ